MQEFNVTKIELNHLLIGVNMKRRDVFPFTAIIGQDMMKLALELNVINPRLGGVLIQGEKGTAKSTAVRAGGPSASQKVHRRMPLS